MQNTIKRTDTRRTLGELGGYEDRTNLLSPKNSKNLTSPKSDPLKYWKEFVEFLSQNLERENPAKKNDWKLYVQFIAVGICIILVANLIVRVI